VELQIDFSSVYPATRAGFNQRKETIAEGARRKRGSHEPRVGQSVAAQLSCFGRGVERYAGPGPRIGLASPLDDYLGFAMKSNLAMILGYFVAITYAWLAWVWFRRRQVIDSVRD